MRPWMVRLHRYVGLSLTAFLVVVGLTGSVIAFFKPLDLAVNPDLLRVAPSGPPLSMLALRERLEAEDPRAHVYYLHFPEQPDHSASFYAEGAIDPATGEPFALDYDEVFADPYRGTTLGRRHWGNFSLDRKNLVTQVYFLHYSLVLPEALGEGFMGFVALAWVIDCFVGLYLTLPGVQGIRTDEGREIEAPSPDSKRGFLTRWAPAWKVKVGVGRHRVVYDLHRALSLWVFTVLLVFAVSGFAFNLPRAYAALMRRVTQYDDVQVRPELPKPVARPVVGWSEALAKGESFMDEQAGELGFRIERPAALVYRRQLGTYFYIVRSSRDVGEGAATTVGIDATTGRLAGVQVPTGHRVGNTFSTWIKALHTATVFGTGWKAFVSLLGLVVVTLSATGGMIWWRKRSARLVRTLAPTEAGGQA